jgi:hypothetical protein
MGELATKTTTNDWLTQVQSSRDQLIEAAKSGNKLQVAFAIADARAQLLESLKNPEVRARLLKITQEDLQLVELANNPSEDDRVRICAIAILSGLTPGDDEFAIFGGGRGRAGKLYLKEKGLRALFAQFGVVPSVSVGHPQWVALGDSGKKVWRVEGQVSVTWRGELHVEEFTGPFALGISGYETDNVDGITAKARRKMLSALWRRVSGLLSADEIADDPEMIVTAEAPAAIEHDDGGAESLANGVHQGAYDNAQTRIKDAYQLEVFNELWKQIAAETTVEGQRGLWVETGKQLDVIGEKNVKILRAWCEYRSNALKGASGA